MAPPDDRDIIPLTRFAPALFGTRPSAKKRSEAIFAEKDPAAVVAAMPVVDLYYLVKDLGIEDAGDLVALATSEQVQGFFDLDVWQKDKLDDVAVRPWLTVLADAGYEKLTQVWRELDPELTALILARWTRIYNLAEEEFPDWEEPPFIPTPDRFFMLKVTVESPDAVKLVERLVDGLYRGDQVLARHTIRSAQSEPPPELEEMAYRWQSGRMQDMGYADLYEALEVYRPIDIGAIGDIGDLGAVVAGEGADRPPPQSLPVRMAASLKQPFLGKVLARVVDPAEAQRLEAALALLLNRVLSANRVSPADEHVADWALQGAATLSLGLETIARGDVGRGEETLRSVALTRIHRVGYSVTLSLARLAKTLGPLALRADEPWGEVVSGLRQPRPQFARRLDGAEGYRPFAEVADVRRVTEALAVLAAQILCVRDLLGVAPPPARTLGDVGRTAVAHALLGGKPSADPIPVGRLSGFPPGEPFPAFVALATEKQILLPAEFPRVIQGWKTELETQPVPVESLLVD